MKQNINKLVIAGLLAFTVLVACEKSWMFWMKTIQQLKVILKQQQNCKME